MKPQLIFKIVSILAPLFCLAMPALGQVTCKEPGVVVMESHDAGPTGELRVSSYRLEQYTDKIFCLSVKMEDTYNANFRISINDNFMPAYPARRGEVTARFPLDWLEQGARISVSKFNYVENMESYSFKERLKLPESLLRLQKSLRPEVTKVSAIRRVYAYAGFKPAPFVEIELTRSTGFYPNMAMNATWTLQIGKTEWFQTDLGPSGRLSFFMTEEKFAQLKNGDPMRVSFAGTPAKIFGKLDKSIFQRAITQGTILRDVPEHADKNPHYLFYLPGFIVHVGNTQPTSPQFGVYQYDLILHTLKGSGFVVISKEREQTRDIEPYAQKPTGEIRRLLKDGVPAKNITVVGASQGSWIAMLASTYLKNRGVNFVLIAACSADPEFLKMVDLHGNILSIYERSDVAQSCRDYRTDATGIRDWKEIEVNTGLKHGFLFRPMKEWVEPTVAWGKNER